MDNDRLRHCSVLHVINISNKLQSGGSVTKIYEESTWKSLPKFGIDEYAGAANYIHNTTEMSFNTAFFKVNAAEIRIVLSIVLTEAHNRIRIVEHSHA